ncbi:hypothetical protein BC834DRAFT_902680 [Gloeopeniophorella convolvens]|nr:hypothetical protein BC834DRAFT_902680 [Gloeopeniophorella convolvens]
MSFSKSCTAWGFERPSKLWADCTLPSGETRRSTLELQRCVRMDTEIQTSTIAPGGFGTGEDTKWFSGLRLDGTMLRAETRRTSGWLFWKKEEMRTTELDLDQYVRNNNGVLEFRLHSPEPSGFWNTVLGWLPKHPIGGAHAPAVTMITNANQKQIEEEEKRREEERLKNTYREGEYLIWKGT